MSIYKDLTKRFIEDAFGRSTLGLTSSRRL
jgi:hypothetical protein